MVEYLAPNTNKPLHLGHLRNGALGMSVARMLEDQRISLGGVSIDEEMANLLVFQRAFQANAKLISVLDEMLAEAISIIR